MNRPTTNERVHERSSDGLMETLPPAPAVRTLVVFHAGGLTGPLFSLKSTLSWLEATGSVDVLLPQAEDAVRHLSNMSSVTVVDYRPLASPRSPAAAVAACTRLLAETRHFARHLRARRPDLVLVVTTRLPAPLIAARLTRVPAILYLAELLPSPAGNRSALLLGRALVRMAVRLSSGVVCCSNAVERQVPSRYRRPRAMAPPDVDIGSLTAGRREAFQARFKLENASPCVAVVGNITRNRGQDLMLRALPLILAKLPDAVCVFAGAPHTASVDRAYEVELAALTADLGIEHAVRWCGPIDPIGDVYAAADIVVNPARGVESFGRVAFEALAAGCPVVSSRAGAVPEVLRDGRDALLVAPNDPEALAGAVLRLVDEPQLAAELVEEGGRRARLEFGAEQAIAPFAHVVREVLRLNRRGA